MQIQLSYRNHFQYGYNGIPFIFRKAPHDQWFVKYGACQRSPGTFKEECLETARIIRGQTNKDLYILFSGGIDSEVVLRSFVEADIKVRAAIMRFQEDLNKHDIDWAVEACNELGVSYEFYDLELLKFWSSECYQYSEKTYCVSPQLLPTMWLADQIPGYAIMGSGECYLERVDAPHSKDPIPLTYYDEAWELFEREKIASWYRHFMIREESACPGFFQYTPEIMLAYLVDPYVSRLCTNKIVGKYTTADSKFRVYQRHFPKLKNRPKYTGYEKVQPQDAVLRRALMERYPYANQIYKSEYKSLIKALSSQKTEFIC